jgi:hypothetical protein
VHLSSGEAVIASAHLNGRVIGEELTHPTLVGIPRRVDEILPMR